MAWIRGSKSHLPGSGKPKIAGVGGVEKAEAFDLQPFSQFSLAVGEDFFVERSPPGIHCHYCWKFFHQQFPNGFRSAELFHQIDVAYRLDTLGQNLGSPANGMEINTAALLARSQSALTHPAFANHSAQIIFLDQMPLVRLFANRSGR